MVKILKASAGSGKTYKLAETYIRLLLGNEDPRAYRHILAVTFTNKATDEMKRRILKELYVLSTDPSSSPYYKDFVPALIADDAALQEVLARAGGQFMRYDGEATVVKDPALLAKVREASPQLMEMYDKNGWEMGLFYLANGHAEIRGMMNVIEEFDV